MSVSASVPPRNWLHRESSDEPHVLDLGRLLLGLVVAAIGVLYLLEAAGTLDAGKAIDHWWPLVIVAAGLLTLAERPPALVRGSILTGIGVVLLLFTTHLLVASPSTSAMPPSPPGGASINATTFCGGVDVLVPKGWRISVRSTPILGGLDDKTDHSAVPPDAPTLHVDALTLLGGVEIKHEKKK